MTWLWIPILIMWMVMAVRGYQKGFVKIIISFLLSIILILLLNPVIEDLIVGKTPILQQLEEFFCGAAVSVFGGEMEGGSYVQQKEILNQIPLLSFVKENVLEHNNAEIYQLFCADSFFEYMAGYFSRYTVKLFSFLITVLLTSVIVKFVGFLLEQFKALPGVGFVDGIGGVFLGLLKGVFYLWIFLAMVSVFASTAVGAYLHKEIIGDVYLNYLYQNNLIIQYIVAMITV